MSDPVLDLDQRLRMPLVAFHGRTPPAPEWFEVAIRQTPERSVTPVEGAGIETLTWGERGRPGLLLVHGGMANADWWAHIGPLMADTHRVAALSMSGCGRSSWRERYSVDQFARELVQVARATGLHEAGPPVFVGHSFGSRPLLNALADPEVEVRAGVLLDAGMTIDRPRNAEVIEPRPHRTYASFEEAVSRFRLMPYQTCENLYIVDYIARQSLGQVDAPPGPQRWTWRSDPFAFHRMSGIEPGGAEAAARQARSPLAFLYGERSAIVRPDSLAYTRSVVPAGTIFSALPDAAHHVFLDQPLATVSALRALLAAWP